MKSGILKIGRVLLFLLLLRGIAHAAIDCPGTLPAGTLGVYYSYTFTGTNGNGGYPWWQIDAGTLPPGLNLTNQALNSVSLTGTPTAAGTYSFRIKHQERGRDSSCVSTIVINTTGCAFNGASTGSISFGNIDPTLADPVIASVTSPQFTCSTGTAYTISVNPAGGWQISSGANTIGYTLGVAPSGTYGASPVDVFTANGSSMTQAQYVNAPAGAYANTSPVTATVSWTGGSMTASLPIGSVTGSVQNACLVTGSPALSFGTVDAVTNAAGATATVVPPVVKCTTNASISVSDNGGLNYSGSPRLKDSSGNYINYSVGHSTLLNGAGGTTDIGGNGASRLNLQATIPAGALDNAPAGAYSDTITLTLSY